MAVGVVVEEEAAGGCSRVATVLSASVGMGAGGGMAGLFAAVA